MATSHLQKRLQSTRSAAFRSWNPVACSRCQRTVRCKVAADVQADVKVALSAFLPGVSHIATQVLKDVVPCRTPSQRKQCTMTMLLTNSSSSSTLRRWRTNWTVGPSPDHTDIALCHGLQPGSLKTAVALVFNQIYVLSHRSTGVMSETANL